MTNQTLRIATINAVTASIEPARRALIQALPGVDVWSILDDRLLQDADVSGGLTQGLSDRMVRLISHAREEGVDAILLTCSLYGPVAESVLDADIPLVSADGPAFDAVASLTGSRVAVVSGGATPLADSVTRTESRARELGSDVELVPVLAQDAALRSGGDVAALTAAIVEAVAAHAPAVDAVFLAQYSLSPAGDDVSRTLGLPVLSGPQWAARRIADSLEAREGQA